MNQVSDACRQFKEKLGQLQAQKAKATIEHDNKLQQLLQPKVNSRNAWEVALDGGGEFDTDTKTALREDITMLEGRVRFLDEAIESGQVELDKHIGELSVQVCRDEGRPAFDAEIKNLFEGLKAVERANRELRRIRDDLHARGIQTGSLPYAEFDLGGKWNDPCGGRVVGFQNFIAQNYPELKAIALKDLE